MKSRSFIHTLSVAAARIQEAGGSPKLVADLKAAAEWRAITKAEGRFQENEDARIARQRTLTAMVPDTHAFSKLTEAMLQRAYDLLWDGDCSGCDALTEFLPSAAVSKMLDAWGNDQDGKKPKSKWYDGQ